MFARLILALLLAAFALPALANGPCHDAPQSAMAGHDPAHGMPAPDERATMPHVCIGCIPPASVMPLTFAPPMLAPALPRRSVALALDPGVGAPPALPPPRRTA